jgi:hypothetical protein
VDGIPDLTKTTRAECEAADGVWNQAKVCDTGCFCCTYRYVCHERVWDYYSFSYPPASPPDYPSPDPIPATQPADVVCVEGALIPTEPDEGASVGCAGDVPEGSQYDPGLYSINCSWADPCSLESGRTTYHQQWYDRYRIVDDCEECVSDLTYDHAYELTECDAPPGGDPYEVGPNVGCTVGVEALSCYQLTESGCNSNNTCWDCAAELEIALCANPLP